MRNLTRKNLFKKNPFKKVKKAVTGGLITLLATAALANPSGPNVRNGQVNISGLGGANVNIEQLTQQAIINWDSFSIGAQEAVRFLQPSQMAVILNRVTGGDPSSILGQLQANGNVFVVNPAGIMVGQGARVDVGGLVLSTLGISDADFLAGNYTFEQDSNQALASIVNQGTITISDGGYAVLTAPLVSNEGLIVANLGKVVLAGGERTTLNFDGRDLINYEIGAIQGEAGTVVLPREAVGGMLSDMLGATDRASDLVELPDGSFALEGASGTVYQAGTIKADGTLGQKAGTVVVDSARNTVLGENSVMTADGVGENSEGGEVYALSNLGHDDQGGLTVGLAGSQLSARGGESGDGGFIEFSGETFRFATSVDGRAENGTMGMFLLDPQDIFVVDGPDMGALPPDPGPGLDLTINDATIETLLATVQVTLLADRVIDFADDVVINQAAGNLKVDSGNAVNGNVLFNDSTLVLNTLDVEGTSIRFNTSDITATTAVFVADGAFGNITQDAGATLTTTELGLQGRGIESNGGNRVFTFDTQNLAIAGGVNSVLLADTTGGLTIVNSVTGIDQTVTAGGTPFELLLHSTGGDLNINANTAAGEVANVAATGDINFSADLDVGFAAVVIADSDDDDDGAITQSAGSLNLPGFGFGGSLGLSAGDGGIGTAGALANGIQIQANELTLETSGDANVVDTAGGLTIVDEVFVGGEVLPGARVEGNIAEGSLQVAATGGDTADLTIVGTIDSVGTNADLVADSDVIFNPPQMLLGPQVNVTGSLIIRADNDNNNDGGIDFSFFGPADLISATNLGLAASADLGDPAGTALEVNFDTFAVDGDPNGDGTGGNVSVRDTNGDFTIGSVTGVNQTVAGARAASDLKVEASAGSVNLDNAAIAPNNIDIIATGSVNLGASVTANAAGSDVVLLADSSGGGVAGAITQTLGTVTGENIGLSAALDIGASGDALDIEATNLAMLSTAGSTYVADATALTVIDEVVGLCFTVTGNTALTDYRAEAGGLLTVDDQVAANNISLISSAGAVTVNQNVTAINGNAVVTANGDISGNGIVQGSDVGLDGANIGNNTNSFDTIASDLTVDSTGNAYIENEGAVRLLGTVTSTAAGDSVMGNNATGDFKLTATDTITVQDEINATDIALVANAGDVDVRFDVNGTQNVVLSAVNGNITGGARARATNVGLAAQNIGATGLGQFNVDAANLAVDATTDAFIANNGLTNPDVTLTDSVSATQMVTTVTGNAAGNDFRLSSNGDIAVNAPINGVTADDIELVAGGSITHTAGAITAVDAAVLEATTNITQVSGQVITAMNVGLEAGGDIGTPGATTGAIDITATNLALSSQGNANVRDTAGGLFVTDNTITGVSESVTGTDISGSLELEALGGNLVMRDVTTVGGSADLVSEAQVRVNQNLMVTGNLVLLADSDASNAGSVVVADGVVIDAAQIGLAGLNATGGAADGEEIMVNTNALTFDVRDSVRVTDLSGDLEVLASVTGVDQTVNMDTATNDIEIEARGTDGNLTISTDIGTSGEQIELVADNNINLNGSVTHTGAGGNTVIVADSDDGGDGGITQTVGQVTSENLGLSAGDGGVGTAGPDAGAITIDAQTLALETSGNANIIDTLGFLSIVDTVMGDDVTVTGGVIGGSLELHSLVGNLVINDPLTVGASADLLSESQVRVNQDLDITGNLILLADSDDNVSGIVRVANTATLNAAQIGLGGLGASGVVNTDEIRVNTEALSYDVRNEVRVNDLSGNLNIVVSVTGVDQTVTTNNTDGDAPTGDIELEAQAGDLNVNANVRGAGNGEIELVAANDVNLNATVTHFMGGTGDSTVIVADSDNDGGGGITQLQGTFLFGDQVGLSAGDGGIGIAGGNDDANAIEMNVVSLAIETSGHANVRDTLDGLTLVDSVTGDDQTVTGSVIGGSLEVETNGGDGSNLVISDDVVVTGNADIVSDDDVILNNNLNAANLVIRADDDGNTTGDIVQNAGSITANALGLRAGGNADNGAGGPLVFEAANLAFDIGGNASFQNNTGNFVLAAVTAVDESVGIASAGGNLKLQAALGSLTVGIDTISGADADLLAATDIILNADVRATGNANIVADSDNNASGSITQLQGETIDAVGVGLSAGQEIGAFDNAIDINATNLAMETEGGNAFASDLTGGIEIVDMVMTACGAVMGNTASLDYRLESAGDITVTDDITGANIALLAGGGLVHNGSTRANSGLVLSATGDISGAGLVRATNVGLDGNNVGSDAQNVNVRATNLAINATNDAFVSEFDNINLVDQVTSTANTTGNDLVTGNRAGGDYRVQADNNIVVQDLVQGDDISLISTTGSITLNESVQGTNDVVISALGNGSIQQSNGLVTGQNVGLSAGFDIGGTNLLDELDVNATTLVARGRAVLVRDTAGGLTLGTSVSSTAANDTVTGSNARNLRVVTEGGTLTTTDGISGGDEIQFVSTDSINLNSLVGADSMVIIADSENDGTGGIRQTQGNRIEGLSLGLSAGDDGIGTAGADVNAIDIQVNNLALETSGSANVLDSADGLFLVNSVRNGGNDNGLPTVEVTGTVIGGSLELEANGGDSATLSLLDDVQVGTNADLVADDDVLLAGNVNVQDSLVIRADNDQSDSGGIQQSPQTPSTVTATNLGLHSAENIGDPAGTPFEVNVATLAVDTDGNSNQVGGGVYIRDNTGDLTIASVTGVDETVGVARSANDLKLEATEGSLNLNTAGLAGDNADLTAFNNVNLNASLTATNNAAVVADSGNNGVGNITQAQGSTINATSVGLSAGQEIGTVANAIDINADNLAAETADGSVFVQDLSGTLNVVDMVTAVCSTVTGNMASVDYRTESVGLITVDDAITAADISLVSSNGGITLNQNVTATGDTVISATGDVDGNGVAGGTNVGLDGNNITLNTAADNLTIDAEGQADVTDADDVTLVAQVTSTTANDTVNGNDASNNLRVEAGGNLNVQSTVNSQNGDVNLVAGTDLALDNQVTANNGNTVLRAGQDITNPNDTGSVQTNQLGLSAGRDVGSIANPVTFDATDLSFDAGNDIIVEDTAGGVNVVAQVAAVNDTVTGNSAGQDARVVANNGSLTVNDQVNVGRNGELVTVGSGSIVLNADYNASSGNTVLRSAGDISGDGLITTSGLGLDAPNGEIGSEANPLRFSADTLTVGSRPFVLDAQRGGERIPEVTAIVETVTDVGEAPPPSPPPTPPTPGTPPTSDPIDPFVDGSTFAPNSVTFIEGILSETLSDNYDKIYNEVSPEDVDDDEFGVRRRP